MEPPARCKVWLDADECEHVAHRAGFIVSVGNWIAPDGSLIFGKNYNTHHWDTIQEHIGETPETDNHLSWMNDQVLEGYIRLVFRLNLFIQVGFEKFDDLWSDAPNITRLREILEKLEGIEIHLFSRTLLVIGLSEDILGRNIDAIHLKEEVK